MVHKLSLLTLSQFCHPSLYRIPIAERSESLSVPIHLSGVQCDGSERGILNCSHSPSVPSNVSHLQDSYVVCRPRFRTYSGNYVLLMFRFIHRLIIVSLTNKGNNMSDIKISKYTLNESYAFIYC